MRRAEILEGDRLEEIVWRNGRIFSFHLYFLIDYDYFYLILLIIIIIDNYY